MKYTIIITVYNKEKYIRRAIESAINQTYNNYQIIIVNDGSTDNSEKIINEYIDNKKIIYYKKNNTGVSDTRNYAIKKVDTEYFLFLDADDYLSTSLLEEVDKYKNYDVLSFNALNLNANQEMIKKMIKPIHNGTGKEFFYKLVKQKSIFTIPWGYIYNTKFFKKNNYKYPKGKILEDFYLTPFIIIDSKKIISIDYVGYYYITDQNGIMSSDVEFIKNTYLEHYEIMKKKVSKYDNHIKKVFISFLSGIIIWYGSFLNGDSKKEYVKMIKKRKLIDLLDKPLFFKLIMKLLFYTNTYYPVRKIIKGGK